LKSPEANQFRAFYRTLIRAWGPQHWWPARTRFEVIVSAYLVQNTAWTNVEKTLRRLRASGLLNPEGIRCTPLRQLQAVLRPAGYFRQKARSLKTFVAFLDQQYDGSLNRMLAQPIEKLRPQLLALNGVGPETADSILLYAGQRPVFVVDAYTRRILDRHHILPAATKYDEIRSFCEHSLAAVAAQLRTENWQPKTGCQPAHPPTPMSRVRRSPLAQVYNDMHGLLVAVGKNHCLRSKPHCDNCPLQKYLP
jgi:endonuclease-3 related protein